MMPYPPPYAQSKTEESQVLRSLGAILALLGMLLAVFGIIFHQGVVELVFALLIALFSLRAFVLWLGDTRRNQKREPFIPPQSALHNSQTLTMPYPPQPGYFVPQQPQSSFFPTGTNQMTVPFAPPAQSFAPGQPVPPVAMPQSMPAPPPAAWAYGPSSYAPGQLVLPAPYAPPPAPTTFPQPGQPAGPQQWGQGQQLPQEEGWQR